VFYRLDEVLSWRARLAGSCEPPWTFTAEYLSRFFIGVNPATEAETLAVVEELNRLGILLQTQFGQSAQDLRARLAQSSSRIS
jgi:hypothetical protein